MTDHRRKSADGVAHGARRKLAAAWQRLGRGWRAVVLGLAVVCVHLLVQTI